VSTPTASTANAAPATIAQARRRRGPDPWKTAFFVVAAAGLVAGAVWALLGSSFFVVRSVRVIGSGSIPRQEVLAAAGIKIGTPLIRVDTGAVARRVGQITQVQSAQVRRSWPDTIVITTVPRTPVFVVRAGHTYDVIDAYGVTLGRVSRPGSGLVLLKSSAQLATLRGNAAVLAAGTVIRGLPAWLRQRLTAVRTRGSEIILILRHGVTVIWGGTAGEQAKAEEVAVLLRTKATYVDVSDPASATTGRPGAG
jgi:cell division protein FtsQ